MFHMIALVSGVAAALVVGITSSASAGTLDQSQTTHNIHRYIGADGAAHAQTFTTGRSGQLDQVDIELSKCRTGPGLNVDLLVSAPGDPVNFNREIASASVPDSSVPAAPAFQFISIPIVPSVTLAAGTQYTIAVFATSFSQFCVGGFPPYEWGASTGNPYPGGADWSLPGEGGGLEWIEDPDTDLAFRTFVESATPTSPTNTAQPAKKRCKKKHKRHAASAKKHCKKHKKH
jgi:hypothetical protein